MTALLGTQTKSANVRTDKRSQIMANRRLQSSPQTTPKRQQPQQHAAALKSNQQQRRQKLQTRKNTTPGRALAKQVPGADKAERMLSRWLHLCRFIVSIGIFFVIVTVIPMFLGGLALIGVYAQMSAKLTILDGKPAMSAVRDTFLFVFNVVEDFKVVFYGKYPQDVKQAANKQTEDKKNNAQSQKPLKGKKA